MPTFYEKLAILLEKNSESGVGGVNCKIWKGCKDSQGYGKKRVLWPSGERSVERTHRLAFMVHNKSSNLPRHNSYGEPVEVSHLCHNKLCINMEHLVLESHRENTSRNYCRRVGVCTMAHAPPCVL